MSVDTQVVGRLPANAACAVVVACCRRLAARVTVSPWQCGRQVARLVDDNKQGPSRWLINCDTAALTSLETFDSNHHRTTSAPATGLYRLDTAVLIASVARTSSLQARSPARRARPTSLRPVPLVRTIRGVRTPLLKNSGPQRRLYSYSTVNAHAKIYIIKKFAADDTPVRVLLRGTDPRYLSNQLCHVVDFGRQLRDFSTSALHDSSLSVTGHSLYCWTTALEQPTWRRLVCLVTNNISAKNEITFIVLPGHYSVLVLSPW